MENPPSESTSITTQSNEQAKPSKEASEPDNATAQTSTKVTSRKKILTLTVMSVLLLLFLYMVFNHQGPSYQLTAQEGNVYRLNNKTGALALIQEGQIVPLEEPTTLNTASLEEVKEWSDIPIESGNITLKLKTKWKQGRLYYIFAATPYTKKLENAHNRLFSSFNINLNDKDNFLITDIPVKISSMIRVVDEYNKPSHILIQGSMPMNAYQYQNIATWDPTWSF
jgi:hypothetical protein